MLTVNILKAVIVAPERLLGLRLASILCLWEDGQHHPWSQLIRCIPPPSLLEACDSIGAPWQTHSSTSRKWYVSGSPCLGVGSPLPLPRPLTSAFGLFLLPLATALCLCLLPRPRASVSCRGPLASASLPLLLASYLDSCFLPLRFGLLLISASALSGILDRGHTTGP